MCIRDSFYYHVTAFLEPDWRALYSAPGHGPYTHLTRPFLAFCARGDWLARLDCTIWISLLTARPTCNAIFHRQGCSLIKKMSAQSVELDQTGCSDTDVLLSEEGMLTSANVRLYISLNLRVGPIACYIDSMQS